MKMTEKEFLNELMTRREAEHHLGLRQNAFQHHMRLKRIEPCKQYGTGSGKVQLFWKRDVDNLRQYMVKR